MQDHAGLNLHFFGNQPAVLRGKSADANHPFRLENLKNSLQMLIASLEQPVFFGRGQFVRCPVAAGGFAECQRTIIGHEVFPEEDFGRTKPAGEQLPKPPAADLRARTIPAKDRPLGMLRCGPADGRGNFKPVTHGGDFAEGNAGLNHAERAGVHAQKHHALPAAAEPAQIFLM